MLFLESWRGFEKGWLALFLVMAAESVAMRGGGKLGSFGIFSLSVGTWYWREAEAGFVAGKWEHK